MTYFSAIMGREARAGGLEALEARRMFSAASPPTVAFEQYMKGDGTSRTFAVFYDGVDPIDRTTLGTGDVHVFGANDFFANAVLVATAKTKHGNGLIARYRVDGIMGGDYSIEMGEGEVTDTTGAMVDPAIIGAFKIGKKGRTLVVNPNDQALTPSVQVMGTTFGPSFAPPAIDTSFGTVIGAVNFGGVATTVTGSTGVPVQFFGQSTFGVATPIRPTFPFSVSIISATQSPGDLGVASVGSEPVYETEVYTASWADEILTVSGLDPARAYRFQFLHGDSRPNTFQYGETTQYFSLPTGESTVTSLSFNSTTPTSDSNTAVIVSGTTGLQYRMPASPTRGPSFSGMVVEVADGGVIPQTIASAQFVRKSVRIVGPSQTFDVAYSSGGGSVVTAVSMAEKTVLVSGPGGYSARALLAGATPGADGTSVIATYRVDGIETTGTYAVSVDGVTVAKPTLFYLLPIKWEMATVGTKRRHHRAVG